MKKFIILITVFLVTGISIYAKDTAIDPNVLTIGMNLNMVGFIPYASGNSVCIELGKGNLNCEINAIFPYSHSIGGFGSLLTVNYFGHSRIGGFYAGGGIGFSFYQDERISFTTGLNIGYKFVTRKGLYFRTGGFIGYDFSNNNFPIYFKPDIAIGVTMKNANYIMPDIKMGITMKNSNSNENNMERNISENQNSSQRQSRERNQSREPAQVPQLGEPTVLQQGLNLLPAVPIAGKNLKFEFGGDIWIAKVNGRNFLAGGCVFEENDNGYILTLNITNVWSGAVEDVIDLLQKIGVPLGPAAGPLRTAARVAAIIAKWLPLNGPPIILKYNEGPPASLRLVS